MTYSLSQRPRALADVECARDQYTLVGHRDSFLDELDRYGSDRLRQDPLAVFLRIRSKDEALVVLAVFPLRRSRTLAKR